MKKIALSYLIALSPHLSPATDGKSLFVSFNDGSKIEFALSPLLKITLAEMIKDGSKSTTTTTSYNYGRFPPSLMAQRQASSG